MKRLRERIFYPYELSENAYYYYSHNTFYYFVDSDGVFYVADNKTGTWATEIGRTIEEVNNCFEELYEMDKEGAEE
jgi:hypothetical protein